MSEFKPAATLEYLDRVLRAVQQQGKLADENKDQAEILKLMIEYKELTFRALKQLNRNGYVYLENKKFGNVDKKTFFISFKGLMLLNEGGFVGKKASKDEQLKRLTELENRQSKMANRLFWINIAIALGTLVAAFYYILEIYKSY